MSAETWLLLSLTLFAGAASPGPSLALVVRTALAHGRLAGVTVALAHGVGVAIYALAVVFGVSGLVTRVDGAMLVIQVLGASFIIYLGAKMLRAGLKGLMVGDTGPLHPDNEYSDKVTAAVHARDGLLIVVLNPKVIIFFVAIFSQFLSPSLSLSSQLGAAALAGIIDASWYGVMALIVSKEGVRDKLQRAANPFDVFFGVLLITVALLVLWTVVGAN